VGVLKKTKLKFIRVFTRALSYFFAGVMVSIGMVANMDTYSWFSSSMMANAIVSAATTQDIIEGIQIASQNPEELKLSKKAGLDYNPVVFFELNGEITQYILHINPVCLDTNEIIRIPFRFSINPDKLAWLFLRSKNDPIKGTIRIKHLNEFIDEEIDIEFTSDFLIAKCMSEILNDTRPNTNDTSAGTYSAANFEEEDELTKLILYLASYKNWGMTEIPGEAPADDNDSGDGTEFNVKPFLMDEEQSLIVDVIVPGLRSYLEEVYSINQKLIEELSNKMNEISELNLSLETLSAEKAELDEKYSSIVVEIEKLKEENRALKEIIDALPVNKNEDDGKKNGEKNHAGSNTEGNGSNIGSETENGSESNPENNINGGEGFQEGGTGE